MKNKIKYITVLALFTLAGALTFFCRVERHAQGKAINLSAIPTVIGDWRMVNQNTSLGSREEKFLDDVLFRAYQRPDGKVVQLAIAYGADQRKNFSIHLPEVCYKASGCSVTSIGQSTMNSPNLHLKQMLAKNPAGSLEAVQYWIVLGGQIVTSEFEKRFRHFYFSLFGTRDSGVLVRVSSLSADRNFQNDFAVQKEFIAGLHKILNEELSKQLFGEVRH